MVSVLMHVARDAECDSYVVLGVIVQVQAVPRTTCLVGQKCSGPSSASITCKSGFLVPVKTWYGKLVLAVSFTCPYFICSLGLT